MNKVFSIAATWIFLMVMIVPVNTVVAEDPASTRDGPTRTDSSAGSLILEKPQSSEFRLFVPPSPPPDPFDGQKLAPADYGIVSSASYAGGYFSCDGKSGVAALGHLDTGIHAYGATSGGYFTNTESSGTAVLASGDIGVAGHGTSVGGVFNDSNGTGSANVGYGDYGIWAYGSFAGGYFFDSLDSGLARVGYGHFGIHALGNAMGGYFKDSDNSGYAYVGYSEYGIQGFGSAAGGYFKDFDQSGSASVGHGDYGISAHGDSMGGYFEDNDGTAHAHVAYGNIGVEGFGTYGSRGHGSTAGGFFLDTDGSGYAYVGQGDVGINAQGLHAGGYFNDINGSGFAMVGFNTSKIYGNGAVQFVQNHPDDRDMVIAYAAPEGDEVATYTRGTARLVDGEARVPLGETFKWVTNPDIGLTAHLTPVGDPCLLYVVQQETDQITVRGDGCSNTTFHYIVYGLRIGFEELSIVQEKIQESFIPSMADHRQLYERRPELKSFNSLERFKDMRLAVGKKEELDLSRAHGLRDTIIEFDPAVHELPGIPQQPEAEDHMPVSVRNDPKPIGVAQGRGEIDHGVASAAPDHQISTSAIPMDAEGNVYAASFRLSSRDLASLLDVSEAVEPGDVLVIDPTGSGKMRRAFKGSDTGVIGVVAASPGVVLGMESPSRIPAGQHPFTPGTETIDEQAPSHPVLQVPVTFSGVVQCKADASYGPVWPGDLLVTSPTPGHAMRDEVPLPGTVLGKALEPLEEGTGTIRVLVMLR